MDTMTAMIEVTEEWGDPIAEGMTFILIQAISTGVVHIHLAGSGDPAPVDGPGAAFVTIARNQNDMESSFSAGGLPTGTKAYVRAAKGPETISVIAY